MKNVIIVAGGKGLRLGGETPKQFLPIGGKPILMKTIEAFYQFDKSIRIIVVLPHDHRDHWSMLCKSYGFSIYHEMVNGGETRFDSVKNGLELVTEGLVAVHDAARPFVSVDLINRSFDCAKMHLSAIPVIDTIDSLRKVADDGASCIVDRNCYKMVQTPQVFEVSLLKRAYESEYNDAFTDDASVVEFIGERVHLLNGERDNIKITTSFDLKLAKALLQMK